MTVIATRSTFDQQAMDKAPRLGQTKQVTVYWLICKTARAQSKREYFNVPRKKSEPS
jgi:hypothetical protein